MIDISVVLSEAKDLIAASTIPSPALALRSFAALRMTEEWSSGEPGGAVEAHS
jgi:hypothetical protein